MKITSIASATVLGVTLLGVGFGPALNDVLTPPLPGEHRDNIVEAILSPERESDSVALIHDPAMGTYTIYPSTLPPCDDEDGTANVNGSPVAACKWDDGTGTPFIIISP